MRLNFRELLSVSRASNWTNTPIVFVSKGYAFPAAEMYAAYVSKVVGIPVSFCGGFSEPPEKSLFLYGSMDGTEVPTLIEHIRVPSEGIQFFSLMLSDSKAKAVNLTKLAGVATVVDVEEPSVKSLPDDIMYACQLLNIPYDDEGVKGLVPACDFTWGSIQSNLTTYTSTNPTLKGKLISVSSNNFASGTYEAFRDKLIFGANWETSILVQEAGNSCIEYTTRILNDLALYHTVLVYDEDGQKVSDISNTFGINEWFLKTRLLPRLRVLKRARLLLVMDKIAEAQKKVLEGGTVNKELFLAVTLLSCLG